MIYFNNNASSYPKPDNVLKAVHEHLTDIPASPYRSGFKKSVVDQGRLKLAGFFNVPRPEHVIFTSGSTEALNLAIFGLQNPKHIITTNTEHNSVLRPLKLLERDKNVKLTFVDCDINGAIDYSRIEKSITPETSAIVLNHASNVTGVIQDLNAVSIISKKYKIPLIADASQTAGAIKIDLQKTPVDFLAFTGHKSLFGTTGIGGLIINPDIKLTPLKTGGTGMRSADIYQPEHYPVYYESGTHNTVGIASLIAGIDYIEKTGMQTIHNIKSEIYNYALQNLQKNNLVQLFCNSEFFNKLPVINFKIKDMDIADTAYILEESFGIIVRAGLHCAPMVHKAIGSHPHGTVRVSFSHNNTKNEVDKFIFAINEICKSL